MSEPVAVDSHYRDEIPLPEGDRYALRRREAVREFFRAGGFPTATQEDWRFSDLDGLARTAYRRYPELTGLRLPEPGELPAWTSEFEHRVLLAEGNPLNAGDFRDRERTRLRRPADRPGGGRRGRLGIRGARGGNERRRGGPRRAAPPSPRDGERGAFRLRFPGPGRPGRRRRAHPLSIRSGGKAAIRTCSIPRSVIELAPGSRLTVVEAHDGTSETAGWTNPSTLCRLGDSAELRYVRVELETGNIAHTGRVTFQLARNARVHSTVLSLTGGKSRTDTAAILTEEGAEVDLDGLFLGVNAAKADQHTLAIHAARHTTSRQLFKNVLSDEAERRVRRQGGGGARRDRHRRERRRTAICCSPRKAAGPHPAPARNQRRRREVRPRRRHRPAGRGRPLLPAFPRAREMDSHEILVRGFAGEVVEKVPVAAVRGLAKDGLTRVRESRSFAA